MTTRPSQFPSMTLRLIMITNDIMYDCDQCEHMLGCYSDGLCLCLQKPIIMIIMIVIINTIFRFWIVTIMVVDTVSVSKLPLTNSHTTITGHFRYK